MIVFYYGLLLGFSLIIAIGPQNVFILKRGISGKNIFIVCFLCASSDAILMFFGIYGFEILQGKVKNIGEFARYLGAVFLFSYGLSHLYSSLKKETRLIIHENSNKDSLSLYKTIVICLSLTFLNPHVYLDTFILIGAVSRNYKDNLVFFWLGTSTASFVFFFLLGYGAAYLRPIFSKPSAWRILDFSIFIVMCSIALSLVF
ncbi:putative amino acid transport protein (LysE family) [Candidatus Competibacter denitrificans Run_A_D11]|uniref:Amino acid transport protein (LysE family) n=1 Tax=Candidatus Competibacter denitrificans Run_A_D11 TaxID=1400863 RepID=W6M9G6_9GAMM|nr:LysE/ArgO family amino acid transporter [Candidatus Competibacter denitrificans]CDI03229.1 putative amino acid transport protein (LysE family) [Candidatus Competibacter denitrificans Run_A_D11]HRC70201.1 LysE/ArgO family amino acid transporter [Candidatus Competibacter denitrificans]